MLRLLELAHRLFDKPGWFDGRRANPSALGRTLAAGSLATLIVLNLAVEAEVVNDPTSMLDISIRIGILNLMEQMKYELGVSMLYHPRHCHR